MNLSIVEIAQRTIDIESKAIKGLGVLVDHHFEQVVRAILQLKGRVVISGVGKSAIVAQKIVATLNSTGTPSLFMHAADAIHGDLGMIQPQDLVILISKSGESQEIKTLVPLIKRQQNILVAMVGNTTSFLAKHAEYIINTTISQEACPNDLAPTSSTTAQMVMGDAIAVALMELRGFDKEAFAQYHPGGNLGKRLYLKVSDLYLTNARPISHVDDSIQQVILEITAKRLGVTVVINESEEIQGIITDGDLRRMLERSSGNLSNITARSILTPNPKTILPNTKAIDALAVFAEYDISHLVVQENGKYLGVLHLHDLIREGIG